MVSRVGVTITLLFVLAGCGSASTSPLPSGGQPAPSGSSGIVPMPTPAWPEFRPSALQDAVAAALGMTCQTADQTIHCGVARDSGASFESLGPDGSGVAQELQFKATGPAALEPEARRLFDTVANMATSSSELSAWWRDRMWANVASGSSQSETLPNHVRWSVARVQVAGSDSVAWQLTLTTQP